MRNKSKLIANKISNFYNWLAGFIDGEGCFCIGAICQTRHKGKYRLTFSIGMSIKELPIIKLIKYKLQCGNITFVNNSIVRYTLYSYKDLYLLIKILTKHPLRSSKRKSFLIFKKVFFILKKFQHKRDKHTGRFLPFTKIKLIEKYRDKMNLTYNKKKAPSIRKKYIKLCK